MTYDKTKTIEAFLDGTAARQATPGGGSVAALAGALAAAMGEMVLNYSIGKKELAEHENRLKLALTELTRARQVMLELMVEDQGAYESLSAARKLPQTDSSRAGKFEAALQVCIRVPQAISATAAAVLLVCEQVVEIANKSLLSDLAVCAELAMATVRCANYNVRVNLADVQSSERFQIESGAMKQVVEASKIIQRTIPRIWVRLEKP